MLCKIVALLCLSAVNSVDIPRSNQCLPGQQPESSQSSGQDNYLEDNITDMPNIHRKLIIRALETGSAELDKELFHRQLTNLLLRNSTRRIPSSELALWISAMIAGKSNPRNYRGVDLVGDLLHRVGEGYVHPYLVLTLVNAHSVKRSHLQTLAEQYGENKFASPNSTFNVRGQEALALKALSCAVTLPHAHAERLDEFQDVMADLVTRLVSAEEDGHFGNIYTTSLIAQALIAFEATGSKLRWHEHAALDYLKQETASVGNIIGRYAIAMAINARRYPCLKDLYQGSYDAYMMVSRKDIYVILGIKNEVNPASEFALTLKVPGGSNLFQVMITAAEVSNRFSFKYFVLSNGIPEVYEVDATPNDAEMGLYWTICFTDDRGPTKGHARPASVYPYDGEHIIIWYRSRDCPSFSEERTRS